MKRVAVLISGGGTNLQALIDAKAEGRLPLAELVCVISNRKKAFGLERAKQAGIESIYLSTLQFETKQQYDVALRDLLLEREIDLIVLAGYLVVLGKAVTDAFEGRILNIHPSLIPSFCGDGFYGLKVHEEVLKRGVKVTGATVHFVDAGTDTGPIVLQQAVKVMTGDTPEILQRRVMEEAEWKLLPEAVRLFSEDQLIIEDHKVTIKGERAE
ncbi:MAG: phosphoribosylglycinamide formyltransferase [Lachnospiraceae bacterium]|jgi:phosphoribosylglycinamide formyltransferase-1|nr:phosphoribosylglycinamide formyltransferase [Lachnospiraceae bacterium]